MNIFVTDPDPIVSAQCLPDKHIVKMPLETCQMLSIVASEKWGHNFGTLPRADGQPYKTDKGAFRNHPCTIWANEFVLNWRWLIKHGLAMCHEYTHRYNKRHTCHDTLLVADNIFPYGNEYGMMPTPFAFAGPDQFKHDETIDIFTKYKRYIASKPWVPTNYIRDPSRKPIWI